MNIILLYRRVKILFYVAKKEYMEFYDTDKGYVILLDKIYLQM